MSTPLQSIRRFCVQCVGGKPTEVKNCGGDKCLNGASSRAGKCWFYKYRMGKGRPSVKHIHQVCLWCQGGNREFVLDCLDGITACPLYPYRMGTNPKRSGVGGKPPQTTPVSSDFSTQNQRTDVGQHNLSVDCSE